MFIIKTRYEYLSREGMQWTPWFASSMDNKFETEKAANEEMKRQMRKIKEIDRKSKRKHEFIIEAI